MNKILTLILIITSSSVIAQRTGYDFKQLQDAGKIDISFNELKHSKNAFLIYPGNWDNAQGAATYYWVDGDVNKGFIFGTNSFGDDAYGQIFRIDNSYIIHGAYYWIGERDGDEGEVVFKVWNFSNGSTASVLGSKTIHMADIEKSEYSDEAFWVEFDEPIIVNSDFLIGADISDLDPFEEDVYGIGNVSTLNGDGAGAALALILEDDQWRPVLDYDMDVDIAIFPLVEYAVLSAVTFNVDMSDAVAVGDVEFDPELHEVYITGDFTNWTIPGDNEAYKLELINENDKDGDNTVYTITFDQIYAGRHDYKYYIVEDTPTDDMGEYPEDGSYRKLIVDEDMVVDDVFGSVFQANVFDFLFLKFNDNNEWVDAQVVDHLEIEYINDEIGKVNVFVEFDTNINVLTPTMTTTYGAIIEPKPETGDFDDFGEDASKTYTVISTDTTITKDWEITIYKTDELSAPEIAVEEPSLIIYPNPVRSILTFEHTDIINNVRIFDLTGRMVFAKDVNDHQTHINMSDFTHGVYIIQVFTDSGIQSRKIQVVR